MKFYWIQIFHRWSDEHNLEILIFVARKNYQTNELSHESIIMIFDFYQKTLLFCISFRFKVAIKWNEVEKAFIQTNNNKNVQKLIKKIEKYLKINGKFNIFFWIEKYNTGANRSLDMIMHNRPKRKKNCIQNWSHRLLGQPIRHSFVIFLFILYIFSFISIPFFFHSLLYSFVMIISYNVKSMWIHLLLLFLFFFSFIFFSLIFDWIPNDFLIIHWHNRFKNQRWKK